MTWRCPDCRRKLPFVPVMPVHCSCQSSTPRQSGGPGTELLAIIPRVFGRKSCGCKSYAAQMNAWGADECDRRSDEIVDHLVSQVPQVPFANAVAKRWVTTAIERSRGRGH